MSVSENLTFDIQQIIEGLTYPENPDNLYAPIRYTMESGGKRLRPTLLLATLKALGGDTDKGKWQALGIEMFHNFTLLHDDVMDDADMRRGRPTVHRRWDVNTAILSGDTMLTLAGMYMMRGLDADMIKPVMDTFNTTAIEVYEGQQYDMDFESRQDVTVDEYLEMIRLKTSVLLGCACKTGAILAGASADVCRRFYDYGINLGLGFQLQDDCLDTFGNPETFGKQIGGDIINEKKTWLLISALQRDDDGSLKRTLQAHLDDNEKVARVTEIYRRHGLDAECAKLIEYYSSKAIAALDEVNLNPESRQYFIQLANQLKTRNH